ncbi:class I SAM-dependent methyltransferase [Paenibacillus sp. D2_2]|uniref:class I SAM-dependent methyltransferase n=1 Tax=Paenibacillus sp. D2_2 TaxID=3073092 RepID=UPI0028162358|nr:class I SAM-dependent methyltransferase [Paenibacillus sp. D2_2]WMT39322.1 class I SAM-dependent methyltransferase [Paenibacillus sp. D2_2]
MSEIVRDYYDEHALQEWFRLDDPYSRIEFISTLKIIKRYLPASGHICDIGSGPGRYSIELLKQGYQATLFELSGKELELAKSRIQEEGLQAEDYICEDARNLHVLKASIYDAALVLGPLYHVHNSEDRHSIIQETYRILKPGGVAIFSYINAWGVLKAGVSEFSESYKDIEQIYDLLHEIEVDENRGFTECYFSTPVDARSEVMRGGFEIVTYAGAEGFLAGMRTEVTRLYQENRTVYDNLLQAASETCDAAQYRDATEHLVIVAVKRHGD